eukprot:2586884-Amphidinium_carterae.1
MEECLPIGCISTQTPSILFNVVGSLRRTGQTVIRDLLEQEAAGHNIRHISKDESRASGVVLTLQHAHGVVSKLVMLGKIMSVLDPTV